MPNKESLLPPQDSLVPRLTGASPQPVRPVRWQKPKAAATPRAVLSLPTSPVPGQPRSHTALRAASAPRQTADIRRREAPPAKVGGRAQNTQVTPKKKNAGLARIAAGLAGAGLAFTLGFATAVLVAGSPRPASQPTAGPIKVVEADESEEKTLNLALTLIRQGKGPEAWTILDALRANNPALSSLSYLAALAALQGGDRTVASSEVAAASRSGERLSDTLALSAVVEELDPGSAGGPCTGNSSVRTEALLRQAIAADQANPAPRLELGMRMRSRGDREAALAMLASARLRLHPVDPATVVDTTLKLIELEQKPVDQMPTDLDPDRSPAALLGATYAALRHEDYAAATRLLEKARSRLPPELYNYLIGDPAFAPYRRRPGLGLSF